MSFIKYISVFSLFQCLFSEVSAQEQNLQNIQKLTFGGDNAEAYFSPDNQKLTLQVTNKDMGVACDQIYSLNLAHRKGNFEDLKLVSTGKGRTTCSYYMPDSKHIIYASTHAANPNCPAPPKPKEGKYLWAVYPEFEIYEADSNGNIVKQLTHSNGYDAEAVVSPDGKKIAFTSIRSGDLEIWTMDIDGSNLKQITFGLGYDGGSFFSHDSKKLVFRSSRPKTEAEIADYKALLAENLVAPTQMEIYTCNVDGSDLKQITHLGKANWAPFFHPSDKKIIFSSNHHAVKGYDFHLYTINTDGTGLRQITFESEFNAFPMFSPDGKKLAFSSNRQGAKPHETNVFIADWVNTDEAEYVQTENLKQHVAFLASDELQGRLAGSKEEEKAAKYIENQLKKLQIAPYFQHYIEPFSYKVRTNPHDTISDGEAIAAHNVVGYLDNHAQKTIVLGAHFDHLGHNEHHNSTKLNSTEVHNGADDNASGVAGVLELARIYSQNKETEKVNILFAFFSGEEDGLCGSKEVASALKKQNTDVVAMLNMDMIGRLDDKKSLVVGGTGTSPLFPDWVDKCKPAGFAITQDPSGVGPSDHTSFYLKDIPVLFFFTGTHADYHKPSDDVDKINLGGMAHIVEYADRLVKLMSAADSIPFTKTKINAEKKAAKFKVTMGIMPDYTEHEDGMHIDGVSEGKPAQLAGIIEGDVLIRIGDCPVKEVYSYMECLAKTNAGETKEVFVLREGKPMIFKVTF